MPDGLNPDAATYTNELGGRQSKVSYDFTLVDPKAAFRLAEVFAYGADKYGKDNWRLITPEQNLNHMIGHAYAWLAGDRSDDHPGHIACRAMMFLASVLKDEKNQDG